MNFSQPGTRAEAISSIMANVQIAKKIANVGKFSDLIWIFFYHLDKAQIRKKNLCQMAKRFFPICK